MRTLLFTLAMMFSVVAFAQQEVQPQYEVEGDMVKATYFHENGQIAQTGYYLNGKLQGVWKAYDRDGKKIAMGNYEQGEKVGKWFFWEASTLNEVSYDNSRIATVTQWNNANPVVINQE
ncbi:toxin-antitoxin system YwqK family antitoxin [Robertkochia sediminum]|uniref:toxin-antitoxin system YwqK family antitoxin n=1 Tax=Robertkochia sediminum TaxID=2785326 RepID=UPI00193482F6|nr:nicotinic acid mononucleotide adenyltransferase [Robertkochia sediminum]MBL7471872.1 nicotinic acid mononucleotide adenyltransferase [Robertkochia sediminum]